MEIFISWFVLSIVAGVIAGKKGRKLIKECTFFTTLNSYG